MALSKTTQDHDEIRNWAEKRGAVPSEVSGTERGDEAGILRLAFPRAKGRKDENLNEISWDEFFEKFDSNNLEMVYQEKTASGQQSNFNKLVHPEAKSRSGSRSRSDSGRSSSSTSRTRSTHSGSSSSARGKKESSSTRSHRRAA